MSEITSRSPESDKERAIQAVFDACDRFTLLNSPFITSESLNATVEADIYFDDILYQGATQDDLRTFESYEVGLEQKLRAFRDQTAMRMGMLRFRAAEDSQGNVTDPAAREIMNSVSTWTTYAGVHQAVAMSADHRITIEQFTMLQKDATPMARRAEITLFNEDTAARRVGVLMVTDPRALSLLPVELSSEAQVSEPVMNGVVRWSRVAELTSAELMMIADLVYTA